MNLVNQIIIRKHAKVLLLRFCSLHPDLEEKLSLVSSRKKKKKSLQQNWKWKQMENSGRRLNEEWKRGRRTGGHECKPEVKIANFKSQICPQKVKVSSLWFLAKMCLLYKSCLPLVCVCRWLMNVSFKKKKHKNGAHKKQTNCDTLF